ncbi:MAG: hypothetical protein AAB360_00025 [Patescibacteria group bacterium]
MIKSLAKILTLTALASLIIGLNPGRLLALDTSKDNFLSGDYKNNLIDDYSFIDINSVDQAAIQKFLDDKESPLRDYSEGGRSAAQIIYDAAHGANEASGDWGGISVNTTTGTVSPKIILTYLEKEQSLISRDDRPDNVLIKAMGYQCYVGVSNDNNENTCNDRYENFTLQIENAAWQLRYNYEYAKRGTKPSGVATHYLTNDTETFYGEYKYNNPDSAYYNPKYYGPFEITFANAATASIYSYTPYIFDSSYNFWQIFNDYFTASPPPPPTPTTNDTARLVIKTYTNPVTVGGSKSAEDAVFFNNTLIEVAGKTAWQLTFETEIGTKTYTVEYKNGNSEVVATKEIEVTRHKTADINGDGNVDIQDLSLLANYWGQEHPGDPFANLNPGEDEVVDIIDLSILASNWNG